MSAAANRIADMVVGVGADTTGLKRGLTEGVRDIEKFTNNVNVAADRMRDLLKITGGDLQKAARMAAEEITRAQETVSRAAASPRSRPPSWFADQLGPATPREAAASGILAAQRRMQFAAREAEAGLFAEQLRKLDPFLQQTERSATRAARALEQVTNGGRGGGTAFRIGGRNAAPVAVATAFGLESLVRSAASAESGFRATARAVATFASGFGAGGIVVSSLIAGGVAISEFFTRTRDELEETKRKMNETLAGFARGGGNLPGAAERAQTLFSGDPLARFGKGPGETDEAFEKRRLGVLGVARAIAVQTRIMQSAIDAQGNMTETGRRASEEIARLTTIEAALRSEHGRVIGVVNELARAEGERTSTMLRGVDATTLLVERLQRIAQAAAQVKDSQISIEGLSSAMADAYRRAADALADMKDQLSTSASSLRGMLNDLNKLSPTLAYILGFGAAPKLAGVGLTPSSGRAPFPTPRITPPPLGKQDLPQLGILERTLGVAVGNMVGTLGRTVGSVLSGTLTAAVGPVALLFRALEPALQILSPLLDKFVAPLAAVAQVVAQSLEPTLRLLFPVLRAFAIVVAFVSEVSQRAAALLARVIGNVVVAIGKLLQKISLGFAGKGLERLGNSFLTFADGAKKSADEMAAVRKKLYGMDFGDTADSISGLGDAAKRTASELLNVPAGFRIALERFLATDPVTGTTTGSGGGTVGGGTGPVGGGGKGTSIMVGTLVVQSRAANAEELFRDVARVARTRSFQAYGTTARAGDTLALRR